MVWCYGDLSAQGKVRKEKVPLDPPPTVGRHSLISQLSALSSKALAWDWEAAQVQGQELRAAAVANECICTLVSEHCFVLTRFISQWAEELQD